MAFLSTILNFEQDYARQFCEVDSRNTVTDLAAGTEIPHSLLLGPWTEGMIQYLYWLIKSGATLDWIASTSGEVPLALFMFQIAIC